MRLTADNRNKLGAYFIQRLHCRPWNTGWLRQGICPSCGKEKKFGANLYINRTNCFSCGYHPLPLNLLMKLENLDTYNEAYQYLRSFDSADYLEMPMPQLEEKEVHLPESYTLLAFGNDSLANIARNYMADRGYDIDYLTMKGVGYCTKGDYKYRIIIPYYHKGELIYFNARSFIQVGEKHKNPRKEEFGIGKSQLIYNIDALHNYNTVYMVESATNALTLGENACGFGGKTVSDYQLSMVINNKCKNVIIVWDSDAMWEALKLALDIVSYKKVKVVKMPEGKDVNDLGKKATLKLVKAAPWENYNQLYKRFLKEPRPIYHLPVA